MAKELTVIKCDPEGKEIWRWKGKEIRRGASEVKLEATFEIRQHHVGGMALYAGDRLVECYYSDRWYNIFEVYDGGGDELKGWYCNLSYPAELGESEIVFRDLALDLIVYADGRQEVLDEDEFEELDLSPEVREGALRGWEELQRLFRK